MGWTRGLLLVAAVALGGCGDDDGGGGAGASGTGGTGGSGPAAGSEGGPCYGNGTCDADLTCSASNLCVLLDPCTGINCSDHGECVSSGGTASCDCDAGYHASGLQCVEDASDPCEGVTCSGHGDCAVVSGAATCDCDTGYEADGLACVEQTDPCDGQNCSGHGTCVAVNGAATCECDQGYEADGLACVEVDLCEGQECSGHGTCAVENGTATCDCEAGYRADGLACLFGEHTLSGTFTIDTNMDPLNGNPNTDQFNDVVGKAVEFVVAFNIESSVQSDDMITMEKILKLTSGPMHVEFAGAGGQSLGDVAMSLEGATFLMDLYPTSLMSNLVGPTSAEYFGFEFSVNSISLALDANGYPVMGPVSGDADYMLRRYTSPPFAMTDYASGPGTFAMQ